MNNFVDGDRYLNTWKSESLVMGETCSTSNPLVYRCGVDYSVFDADGDGRVELPVFVNRPAADYPAGSLDPTQADLGKETEAQDAYTHTILHEICHAVGCNAGHTTDPADLQYYISNNWDRGSTLGEQSAGEIYIHNETE